MSLSFCALGANVTINILKLNYKVLPRGVRILKRFQLLLREISKNTPKTTEGKQRFSIHPEVWSIS